MDRQTKGAGRPGRQRDYRDRPGATGRQGTWTREMDKPEIDKSRGQADQGDR